jgi:hypothetical protein
MTSECPDFWPEAPSLEQVRNDRDCVADNGGVDPSSETVAGESDRKGSD